MKPVRAHPSSLALALALGSLLPLSSVLPEDEIQPGLFKLPTEKGTEAVLEAEDMDPAGNEVAAREEEGANGKAVRLGTQMSRVRALLQGPDGVYRIRIHAAGDEEGHDVAFFELGPEQGRMWLPRGKFSQVEPIDILVSFEGFQGGEPIPIALRAEEAGIRIDRIVFRRSGMSPEKFDEREAEFHEKIGSEDKKSREKVLRVRSRRRIHGYLAPTPVFTPGKGKIEIEAEQFARKGRGGRVWPFSDASGGRVAYLPNDGVTSLKAFVNLPAGVFRLGMEGGAHAQGDGLLDVYVAGRKAGLTLPGDEIDAADDSVYFRVASAGDVPIELKAFRKSLLLDRIVIEAADKTQGEFEEDFEEDDEPEEGDDVEDAYDGDRHLDVAPQRPD